MKDKEKQIEEMRIQRKLEMTRDISNGISGVLAYEIQKLAEHLISLNYEKLPENSVVLSKEEYEKLHSFDLAFKILAEPNPVLISAEEYEKLKQSRKETAEKCNSILEKNYKDWLKVLNDLKIDTSNKNILVSIVCGLFKNSQEEIAKQFGVEVDKWVSF